MKTGDSEGKGTLETRASWKALAAVMILVALCGCGGGGNGLAEVTGQVLLDGKPLTVGTVITLPDHGRGAQGAIDSQGRFTLDSGELGSGASVGVHRVAVAAYEGPAEFNPEGPPRKSLVPRHYTNPETSGLVIDVEPGKVNEVVLELSSK